MATAGRAGGPVGGKANRVTFASMPEEGLTYQAAGVNLGEARRALDSIRAAVRATYTPGVLSEFGSFGGLFAARFDGYEEPILVSSMDGIGTKTAVASMVGLYRGLGRDIVGHCVNDILVHGAKPLFFLDYFAASLLNGDILTEVVDGAAEACVENGCALLGGETAEMPGVYRDGELDIVGSIVGVVERSRMLPVTNVGPGDLIVGLASDGLHTNGFSLARAALFESGARSARDLIPELGRTLGEELLRPHRAYFRPLEALLDEGGLIKAIAHVTGGGLYENLPRVLGRDLGAVIERRSWTPNPVFAMIQEAGGVSDDEMFRVFNMGIGMALICSSEVAGAVVQRLSDAGESAHVIGEVAPGRSEVSVV